MAGFDRRISAPAKGWSAFGCPGASGYEIIPKSDPRRIPATPINDNDLIWAEGRPQLVTNLRRERGSGLAAAKRDEFRSLHGRLYCERCEMDPVETFASELGEPCIEVHHNAGHVADMGADDRTRLTDLQCLYANCHRVTHRELKTAALMSATAEQEPQAVSVSL